MFFIFLKGKMTFKSISVINRTTLFVILLAFNKLTISFVFLTLNDSSKIIDFELISERTCL